MLPQECLASWTQNLKKGQVLMLSGQILGSFSPLMHESSIRVLKDELEDEENLSS